MQTEDRRVTGDQNACIRTIDRKGYSVHIQILKDAAKVKKIFAI